MSKLQDKDLMVGDWLLYNGETKQVMEVLFDSVTIDCFPCSYYRLEPIPLTAEILEKNFAKDKQWMNSYFVNDHIHIYDTGEGYFNLQYCELFEIRYIHQLQHILRLWGIEKEVQL